MLKLRYRDINGSAPVKWIDVSLKLPFALCAFSSPPLSTLTLPSRKGYVSKEKGGQMQGRRKEDRANQVPGTLRGRSRGGQAHLPSRTHTSLFGKSAASDVTLT